MNTCESENYLAISRSSSASNSVEIFWAEIYRGDFFLGPNLVSASIHGRACFILIIIIIRRNGAKTISLQTTFGRLKYNVLYRGHYDKIN
jgi:hypothetical protein